MLVTGAAGLLGHWLLESTPCVETVVALTYRRPVEGTASFRIDLLDAAGVGSVMSEVSPRLVIHAAYAKSRESIVDATRNLVDAASAAGAHVMLISSDAVFAGDGSARDEQAQPDAAWDYGRWKAEAEQVVLSRCEHGAVVRLSLLVSIDPEDHVVEQIRAGVAARQPTRWFTDEMRQPLRAADAAVGIWRIVGLGTAERSGVWHLVGPERLSRYEIARRTVRHLHLPESSIEPAFQPASTDRPRDIALRDARARATIGWAPAAIP